MLKKYLLYQSTKEAPSYNVIGETFNQKHDLAQFRLKLLPYMVIVKKACLSLTDGSRRVFHPPGQYRA